MLEFYIKYNFFWFLPLGLFVSYHVMGNSYEAKIQTFSNALQVIRENYKIKNSIELDLVVMDEICENFALSVISNLLKDDSKLSPKKILKCSRSKSYYSKDCVFSRSAIIFIGNIQNFFETEISRNLKTQTYDKVHFYLVSEDYGKQFYIDSRKRIYANSLKEVTENGQSYFNEIFRFVGQNSTLLTSLITSKKDSRNLVFFTLDYLSGPFCSHKMKLSNEFSFKYQKWKKYRFGLSNFNQFHGCNLLLLNAEPFVEFDIIRSDDYYVFIF